MKLMNCRALGCGLALLCSLAAADAVVTSREIIFGTLVSADTSFVRMKLSGGGIRMLEAREVSAVRLTDSSRVAELAARLPGVDVAFDSGGPLVPKAAPGWEVRAAAGGGVDTVGRGATSEELKAACKRLRAVLLASGQAGDTIRSLLREVELEDAAVRAIQPPEAACLSTAVGALPGALLGTLVGGLVVPPRFNLWGESTLGGCGVGCGFGGLFGAMLGASIGSGESERRLADHRTRVNGLVLRVRNAVAIR